MSVDGRNGRSGGGPDAAPGDDLSGRLERLGAKLETRRPAPPPAPSRSPNSSDPSGLARALRVSSEFIAGVIVGGGLGWAFDKGLGTSPWGLIVFLLLGFAAGIMNVLRTAGTPTVAAPQDRREGR